MATTLPHAEGGILAYDRLATLRAARRMSLNGQAPTVVTVGFVAGDDEAIEPQTEAQCIY